MTRPEELDPATVRPRSVYKMGESDDVFSMCDNDRNELSRHRWTGLGASSKLEKGCEVAAACNIPGMLGHAKIIQGLIFV